MMGISPQEFVVIAIFVLIVIGPRELPGTLRAVARVFAMAQRAAREARSHLDQMMREAELDSLHRDIESAGTTPPPDRQPPVKPAPDAEPPAPGQGDPAPPPSRQT